MAVILMVAITVILSAAVGALVFDLGQSATQNEGAASSSAVSVQHISESGADALELTVVSTEQDVTYSVNGGPKQSLGGVGASTQLTAGVDYAPGDTITVFSGDALVQSIDTSASAQAAMPAGLISHWGFEEDATASTAVDSEGVQNGTIYGGASYVAGPNGDSALAFDGTDDRVDLGTNSAYEFDQTQDFSISVWYRVPSSAARPLYLADTWNWQNGGWFFRAYPTDGIHFRVDDASGAVVQVDEGATKANASLASADDWHHAVASMDRDGKLRVYVDGQLVNSTDATGLGDITTNQRPLTFAYQSQNGQYSEGWLSSVRVYDHALSRPEVEALYADGT